MIDIDRQFKNFLAVGSFSNNDVFNNNNVWENTLIALTSDNGGLDKDSCIYLLLGGKNTFHDDGPRVLVLTGSDMIPDEQRGTVLDSNVDWKLNFIVCDYKHIEFGDGMFYAFLLVFCVSLVKSLFFVFVSCPFIQLMMNY